jgi:hypothetical protein
LPAEGKTIVVIHHSVDSSMSFVAFASCDLALPSAATQHFDIMGAPLWLPEELRTDPNESSRGPTP